MSKKKIILNYPAIAYALSNLQSQDSSHIRCTVARLESPFYRLKTFLTPLILTSLAHLPVLASFFCFTINLGYVVYFCVLWYRYYYIKNILISICRVLNTLVELLITSFAFFVSLKDPNYDEKHSFSDTAQTICLYAIIFAVLINTLLSIVIVVVEIYRAAHSLWKGKVENSVLPAKSTDRNKKV